jgi:hypothetical protein
MVCPSPPTDQSWPWREAMLVDPDGQQISRNKLARLLEA